MERELLLLGMLRMQEQHGYQLNEAIQPHLAGRIPLTKTTAYDLLKKMTLEGWVTYREERVGNRPQRRLYAITAAGEAAFQQILRECLSSYRSPDLVSDISLAFLDVVSPNEAFQLLSQRRAAITSLLNEASSRRSEHPGGMSLMIEHLIHVLTAEVEWVDEIISHYKNERDEHV